MVSFSAYGFDPACITGPWYAYDIQDFTLLVKYYTEAIAKYLGSSYIP